MQKTNECFYAHPINFVLGFCIAAAPDLARDYWCTNYRIRISTQAA